MWPSGATLNLVTTECVKGRIQEGDKVGGDKNISDVPWAHFLFPIKMLMKSLWGREGGGEKKKRNFQYKPPPKAARIPECSTETL